MRPAVVSGKQSERLYVSTLPGLEDVLAAEARALGLQVRPAEGGVELEGPPGLHQEANLHLRTASRVLWRLGQVRARDAASLERALARLPLAPVWGGHRPVRLSLARRAGALPGPVVETTAARAWRLPRLERAAGLEEDLPEGLTLALRLVGEECSVSVDTSGDALHRRGYRQEVGRAPLRETLAAGILHLAAFDGCEPLVDPMCGSGTFLIEAGWMSRRQPPGLERAFAFEAFPTFDAAAWQARRAAARAGVPPAPLGALVGYDIHAGALGTARRNARRAGLTLQLERRDVRTLTAPPGPTGLVVANPPYGKRVGEETDLPGLYQALGATLRGAFRGWRAALLVPDERPLAGALGLTPERSWPLRNGGLRCRLLLVRL